MTIKTENKFDFNDFDLILVEEAVKNDRLKMAKKFKELGVEIEKISKATELTKEEIENL